MIPVYNRTDLLREALESVLYQYTNEQEMEIWVVDDYSTVDNPLDIINEIGVGKVKFFRQEKNVGQIANLNKCIDLANGELIHILHCDDKVLPGFYEQINKAFSINPNCGAYFTRNNFIDHSGCFLRNSAELQETSGIIPHWFEKISTYQKIQTPSIVVQSKVYKQLGGFKSNLTWTEDWEMWVRIAEKYSFYYINEVLASYREANNSNSSNSFKTGRFIEDLKKVIDENYKHHKSKTIKQASQKFYSRYIISVISAMLTKKELTKSETRSMLKKYFKCNFLILNDIAMLKTIVKLYVKTILL
jgi:glycosyltransferase involved in cell wall biosynthesis